MKKGQQGFTLIEVILVLAILGLLLGVAMPSFQKPFAHYQLRSVAMQMAADMRWARQQSIYGRAGMLKFWVLRKERQYLIQDATRIVVQRSLPAGIEFHEIVLERNPLTFTLTGAPSIGGRVVFRNAYGELSYVYFMPSSGRIRISYEDLGEEWLK